MPHGTPITGTAVGYGAPPGDDPTRFDPLIIEGETGDGNNAFEELRWLGPAFEITRAVNELPTARIPVRLDKGMLVDLTDGNGTTRDYKPIDEALYDDRLVQICTARPFDDQDVCVFRGYLQTIDRSAHAERMSAQVRLVHEATVLQEAPRNLIYGQLGVRQIDQRLWRRDPVEAVIPLGHASGLPCIFNPDGEKNCAKDLVYFRDEQSRPNELEPATFTCPVFASKLDDRRQNWTWARVFLYILFWLRRVEDAPEGRPLSCTLGNWPQNLRGDPIRDRNLWAAIAHSGLERFDPSVAHNPPSHPLERILTAVPQSHSIEGLSALQALKWSCAKSGLGFAIDTYYDSDQSQQGFRSSLRFFAPGWVTANNAPAALGNRITNLKLASPDYRTDNKEWSQVLVDNNVINLQLKSDYSGIKNHFKLVGSPVKYEVTIELVPGWKYDPARTPQVDVDPQDTAAVQLATDAIDTNTWHDAYDYDGAFNEDDDNGAVLRRWILPDFEDLSFDPQVDNEDPADDAQPRFPRPWTENPFPPNPPPPTPPWGVAKYRLYDWGKARMGEALTIDDEGEEFSHGPLLLALPRPVKQCLTGNSLDAKFPPVVEISTEAGAANTWKRVPLQADIYRSRCGLMIKASDLSKILGKDGKSFAHAFVEGKLRVRITGTVEGDMAAGGDWLDINAGATLSRRERAVVVCKPNEFKRHVREDVPLTDWPGDFAGGNSQYRDVNQPDLDEKPFNEEIEFTEVRTAAAALQRLDRLRHWGTAELHGLMIPHERHNGGTWIVEGYRVGDEVESIMAQAGNDQVRIHDLKFTARRFEPAYAVVASLVWRYDPGDGSRRGPHAITTMTLEDAASLVSFSRGQA